MVRRASGMWSSPRARTSPGIIARRGKLGFNTRSPRHHGQRSCLPRLGDGRFSTALCSVIGKQTLANQVADFNSSILGQQPKPPALGIALSGPEHGTIASRQIPQYQPQATDGTAVGFIKEIVSATCVLPARVLIADDQPDLIDALRLLLKREAMHVDAVHVARVRRSRPSPKRRFDLVLMDLNYTGDTTSGREGIDLAVARAVAGPHCCRSSS